MIITTTNTLEGKSIKEYKGIVFGEVIADIDFFGGSSNSYETKLIESRLQAINKIEVRAKALGANAIVGVNTDYKMVGIGGPLMMITVSGTAVIIE